MGEREGIKLLGHTVGDLGEIERVTEVLTVQSQTAVTEYNQVLYWHAQCVCACACALLESFNQVTIDTHTYT